MSKTIFDVLQSTLSDSNRNIALSDQEDFNFDARLRKHLSLVWIEMEPNKSSSKVTDESHHKNRKIFKKRSGSHSRKVHNSKSPANRKHNDENNNLDSKKDNLDTVDKETQIMQALQESIEECSDQRLRALLMLFRKTSNMENRITLKDLNNALQELSIKIPNRVLSDLVEQFTDQYGIDFERMYKLLIKIQSNSNRDSAKVKKMQFQTAKESDLNVLKRIANTFQTNSVIFYANFDEFKQKLYQRCERHHSIMLSNREIAKLLDTHHIPLYGALLNAAFERTNHNNLINATKFVNFLEEAARLNIESNLNKQTSSSDLKQDEKAEVSIDETQNTYLGTSDANSESQHEIQINYVQQDGGERRKSTIKGRISVAPEAQNENQSDYQTMSGLMFDLAQSNISENVESVIKVKLNHTDEVTIPANNQMPPSNFETANFKFEIDWIYGYSGIETKHNLISVPFTNEIAYSAGSIIVLYNLEKKRQRYFREHTTLVKCLCLYLNGFYIISASIKTNKTKQVLKLWRVDNLKTIRNLAKDHIQGSIVAMSTSKYAAEKIVVVDQIDQIRYQIIVLDINRDIRITSLELNSTAVIDVGFNPKEENYIVTIGKEHLGFWRLEQNKIVELYQPNYERNLKALYVTCFCFKENGDLVTGDSNGNIYIWPYEENRISQVIKHGHEGSILSMTILGPIMITTGRDNKIYGWSFPKLDHAGALQLPKQECGIKLLLFHKDYIIVATKFNSLYYAQKVSNDINFPLHGALFKPDTIAEGHSGEISQLNIRSFSSHEHEIISCGLDGVICIYKPLEHEIKYKKCLKGTQITAIEVTKLSHDGLFIGTSDGTIIMANLITEQKLYTEVAKIKISNLKIENIQLSPDETQLIASAKTGIIYLLTIFKGKTDTIELILNGSFKEHKSELSGIDWSSERINGTYLIRSSSYIEKKLLIWRANDFIIINDYMQLDENLKWFTQNCLFTHESIGTFSLLYTEKNPTDFKFLKETSNNYLFIIDTKTLNLYAYPYPASNLKTKYRKYTELTPYISQQIQQATKPPSTTTTTTTEYLTNTIKYSQNLNYLFIADSTNSIIIQWKLIKQ